VSRSDRPWSRKLVRLGFKILGKAHYQDTWPGLLIDRQRGHVLWRKQPLVNLRDPAEIIPRGLPMIAIVGSGPSLRDQRIDAIGDRCAILCNGAASLVDRLQPLAIAVEDERFVFRHWSMLVKLPNDIPVLLSPAAMRAWAERDADSLRGRAVVLIENLKKPVGQKRRSVSDPGLKDILVRDGLTAMSTKPADGVIITGTIAFSALQFALASAPKYILLAGIDLNNDTIPRFYESNDCAKSGLSKGLPSILAGFSIALSHAKRQGVELGCASPSSALLALGYKHDCILE